MGQFIKSAIQRSSLLLDAIKGSNRRNKFVFAASGKQFGAAIIKSAGPNKIRLFRGFQARQGTRFIPIQDKIYGTLEGVHHCFLAVFDEQQQEVDRIEFKGKIAKDMDAIIYNFRMESVSIAIENIS